MSNKRSAIQVRVDEDFKNEFYKVAKENAQVPTYLIRKWIEDYIENNKDKEQ